MNINLDLYKVFYVVANNQNITSASKELLISQPAISKSIKTLEDQLGGPLFIRTKRGVILTEEGKELYYYIKEAMNFINNAENKFKDLINLETGTIRIGISQTLTKQFLLPYLEIFHKTYPKIQVQINTSISKNSIEDLRKGDIDLIISNLPLKIDADLEVIKVKEIQDCFIVNKDYLDLTKRKITLEELNNYPLILQPQNNNTRKFLDNYTKQNNVILNPTITLGSYTLVVEFTKIGYGIGYATEDYLQEELKNKNLYKLDITPKIPTRSLGIIISKNNIPSFSAKKLIEIIKKNI
jgi:DNA-binding transcriptional LysR family regulator